MLIRVAIADKNTTYVNKVIAALEDNSSLIISAYSDAELLKKDIDNQKIDVLLFDPSVYSCEYESSKQIIAVLLFDDSIDIPPQFIKYPKVNKYQRVSKTLKTILDLFSDFVGNKGNVLGNTNAKVISVFSPSGGAGCTTISLAIAERLASSGMKAFFISFEEFASEGFYLPQGGEYSTSDILALLGENVDTKLKLQAYTLKKTDNLYYTKHFSTPNDLYVMSKGEAKELINLIVSSGLFDYVVVDVGSTVSVRTQEIFDSSESIFIVEKSDEISASKLQGFFSQLQIIGNNLNKMRRVINFSIGKPSRITSPVIMDVINAMQNPDPAMLVKYISDNHFRDISKLLT